MMKVFWFVSVVIVVGLVSLVFQNLSLAQSQVAGPKPVQPAATVSVDQLAFYMLDSEDAPILASTPIFILKTFTKDTKVIVSDIEPYLSVETKADFFKTTWMAVMSHSSLTPMQKEECARLEAWIKASSQKIVGYQWLQH